MSASADPADVSSPEREPLSAAEEAADAAALAAAQGDEDANEADDATPSPDGDETPGTKKKRRRRRRRRKKPSANAETGEAGGSADAAADESSSADDAEPPPADGNADKPAKQPEPTVVTGVLELGFQTDGRVRQLQETYHAHPDDAVVPVHLVERLNLRPGVTIEARLGKPANPNGQHGSGGGGGGKKGKKKKGNRSRLTQIGPASRRVEQVLSVDGLDPAEYDKTVHAFEDLTTIMPQPRLSLEYPGCPASCRLVDLFCPIGFGTRGMIVSPPKAGKTTLLQDIAKAISHNHPDVEVYALLVDERPEEVTDFRRNVPCTVWASSNDHPVERHVGLALNATERCKRHAEEGRDVVILLDSLTRLGRAFNTAPGLVQTGRTLSGGLDAGALAIPKQIFGAARKFEEGGSLTIIATALVDTGSRGDQVIFEEFKGTGNMELILDRKIAEQRVFPAIDLAASGTRNEHLLMSEKELGTVTALRRRLLNMQPVMQVEQLLRALDRFETNEQLIGNPQSPGNVQTGPRR